MSCLAGVLLNLNCLGMKRIKSDSDVLSLHEIASAERKSRSSDFITAQKKAYTIEITSMAQFRELTKDQTRELKSVTFRGMKINEEFVNKFWELFSCGINELSFESCYTVDDYSFSDLFDGDYSVRKLIIKSNDLTVDDVDSIFALVYPYLIRHFVFGGKLLDVTVVKSALMKRLGSCSPKLEVLSTNS